jgi:hypothetical protein
MEPSRPEPLAEDRGARAARSFLFVRERTACERRHAEHGEEPRRHPASFKTLGLVAARVRDVLRIAARHRGERAVEMIQSASLAGATRLVFSRPDGLAS